MLKIRQVYFICNSLGDVTYVCFLHVVSAPFPLKMLEQQVLSSEKIPKRKKNVVGLNKVL
jgi:hypothetical protein